MALSYHIKFTYDLVTHLTLPPCICTALSPKFEIYLTFILYTRTLLIGERKKERKKIIIRRKRKNLADKHYDLSLQIHSTSTMILIHVGLFFLVNLLHNTYTHKTKQTIGLRERPSTFRSIHQNVRGYISLPSPHIYSSQLYNIPPALFF